MELVEISCPFCNQSETRSLHREGVFQMVTCASCQFVYLNPRPAEEALLEFYQDYLPRETSSIEDWKRMMGPIFRRSSRLIRRYNKDKGRLLDVGTGFGFFLAEMKHQGWEVEGVEISQKGINYGREVLKLTVHPGPLEAIGFPEKVFDVVTAFYVIEHLPDPMAFLRECYRILKPGGLLLLRYPHTTPIKNLLRTLRVKNRLYDLPAHLSDFSPGMIEKCLEGTGFIRCQHRMGGYTLPKGIGKHLITSFFGNLGEALFFISQGKFLLSGVSKTIIGFK